MMNISSPYRWALLFATALTGCSQLQDVNHRWCDPEVPLMETKEPLRIDPPPPPTAAMRTKIQLQADALFKFNGSTLADMRPAGRQALDELVAELQSGYIRVNQIQLVGYTDRLGSNAYNLRLSQQRADSVKQYLQSKGITQPIEARGMGKADPVTKDCPGSKASPALIQCLQPDRRVEVEIDGVKKVPQP